MRITIERDALLKSIAQVMGVVERKNTIPILSNLRIDATSDNIALLATDMDSEATTVAECSISQSGSTTVPAHTLSEIVRKLASGSQVEIDYSAKDTLITIRSGRSKFTLACLPVEDFPVFGDGKYGFTFTMPASDLATMVSRCRMAMSTEETRYYLNGIYLHPHSSGMLRAAATDGHRLVQSQVALPDGAAGMPGVIVPRKTVGLVAKMLDGHDKVTISVSETKIRFQVGSEVLSSKLIDGTFPDYERVIPAGNDKVIEVGRMDLRSTVQRVTAISSEKGNAVRMTVAPGSMTLSASSPENGSAEEAIDLDYQGRSIEIGFNGRYLVDMVEMLGGDVVRLAMADASSPVVVTMPDDDCVLSVLMPMRV